MKNYSVAIFGSSLRADFDKYSDRDLLIVAEDYKTLGKLKEEYSNGNWSISFYTYSKLEYLSKNGSLFIKHLQNESKILLDNNNCFNSILANYKPKEDYKNEIQDSVHYFKILENIPNSSLGFAWYCDCLFVGLRNYLVFKNAQNGIFEFSFIKLLNILKSQGKISFDDINILRELRVIKRNYRTGILNELPSKEFIKKVIPITVKLKLLDFTKCIKSLDFQNKIEDIILEKRFDYYQRLRLVEGFYSSKEIDIPELKKIISNPQFYASKLKDNGYTLRLITEIKNATQQRRIKKIGQIELKQKV